ncbi:sigma-70 family RNA polymerase sigma factor [Actinoplanes sp. NPDC051343]|uniref:sigma-70 family RNA polymerase sigma factor n=1 Tax=Actinoplanes sp. NPDC051343 TaxID=3363906 RepID=UPI00379E3185
MHFSRKAACVMQLAQEDPFVRLTDPFRRELLAHCYRMTGSLQDAEDLVQETYIRAWRSYDRFEGRSSMRLWLYRIATNVCLTALEHHSRRLLPSGLGPPSDDPDHPLSALEKDTWIQPLPGPPMDTADPATIVAARDSVRLALIAALQHLPAKQRVALILRDVLAWRANEVADLLGTTGAAVNSLLQRARTQLRRVAPAEDHPAELFEPGLRALLDQYITAFQNADINALMEVLRDDVALEMPPNIQWFTGRATVGQFLRNNVLARPDMARMFPTTANGQPAVAAYWRGNDDSYRAHALQVLTITHTGISRIVSFNDPELFPNFGLARVLTAEQPR